MKNKLQSGFSLVELMVALIIGLLLIAGVIEVFISSRQVYRVQDMQARMQEDGRYATSVIAEKLSRAGFRGCNSLKNQGNNAGNTELVNVLTNANDYFWDLEVPIQGHEATNGGWSPGLPDTIANSGPIAGTDVITIRTTSSLNIEVRDHDVAVDGEEDSEDYTAPLIISADNSLPTCDPSTDDKCNNILLVSDCTHAAVFQVTNDPDNGILEHEAGVGKPGNATADLKGNFAKGTITNISSDTFYVKNDANGNPSLYQKTLNENAVAIVEGVENMQVEYGIDTNGDLSIDRYVKADNVPDWSTVLSVKISLSMINIAPSQETTDIALGGGRLRTVFSKTIVLRNRIQ